MKSTAMLLAAAAAAVATVATAPAEAAGRASTHRAVASRPAQPPAAPNGGAVVLYSQLASATTSGALSAPSES